MVHFRENGRGYPWQGRVSSFALEGKYLYPAIRYVERNPVRAGIVKSAQEYGFSSATAHVHKTKDIVVSDIFVPEGKAFLAGEDNEQEMNLFKKHARGGRSLS